MTPIVFNAALLASLLLVGGGAAAQWGAPVGAIVAGLQLLGCTYTTLIITRPRKG